MAQSSLLGIDPVAPGAGGHDSASLGPSDTSDSGSDIAGLDEYADDDATLPVDVAIGDERAHPWRALDSVDGSSDSDSNGTGERRSVGGDGEMSDGADIAPDRIVSHPDQGVVVDADGDDPVPLDRDDERLGAMAVEETDLDDEEPASTAELDASTRPRRRRPG